MPASVNKHPASYRGEGLENAPNGITQGELMKQGFQNPHGVSRCAVAYFKRDFRIYDEASIAFDI